MHIYIYIYIYVASDKSNRHHLQVSKAMTRTMT